MKDFPKTFIAEKTLSWEEFINVILKEEVLISINGGYIQYSDRFRILNNGDFWYEYDNVFRCEENPTIEYCDGWFKLTQKHEYEEKIVDHIDEDGEIHYKKYYDGYTDIEETRGTGEYFNATFYLAPLTIKKIL